MWPFSSLSLFQRHRKERSGICEWCLCVALGGPRPPRVLRPGESGGGKAPQHGRPAPLSRKAGEGKASTRRTDGATLRVRGRQGVVVVDLSCWPYGQEPPPTSWVRVTASSSRPRRARPPVWRTASPSPPRFGGEEEGPSLDPPAWEEKAAENSLARAEPNLALFASDWVDSAQKA